MGKELAQTKGASKYNEKSKRMASPMASYEDRLKAVLSRKSQLEESRLTMARQRIIENALKHEKLLAERKKDLETKNQTNTSRIAAVLKRREQILLENHARKVEILRRVELKCIKAAELKSKAKGKVSKRKTSLSQAIFHQLELPVNKYKNKICTMPKTVPAPKRLVNTSKTVAPKSPITMSPKRKIRSASGSRVHNNISSTTAAVNEAQKSKTLGRPKKAHSVAARDLQAKKEAVVATASEPPPKGKTNNKQDLSSQDKSSGSKEKDAEIEFYKQKMAEHRRAMRDKMNANKTVQLPAKVKAPTTASSDVSSPVRSPAPSLMAAQIKPETDQLDRSINDLLSIANTEVGRINTLPDSSKVGSKSACLEPDDVKDEEELKKSDTLETNEMKDTPNAEIEDNGKVLEDQNLKLFEKEEQMMIEQETEKQKLEDEREKQRIEAEKVRLKEQEEFERLQDERRKAEEEERAERRARLEAIMKRTRSASVAKSSSPAPNKSEPAKEPPIEPEDPNKDPESQSAKAQEPESAKASESESATDAVPEIPKAPEDSAAQTTEAQNDSSFDLMNDFDQRTDDSDQRNESETAEKAASKEYSREHSVSPEPVMESALAVLTPTEEGVKSASLTSVPNPDDTKVEADSANSSSSLLEDLDPLSSGAPDGTGFSGLEDSGISLAGDDLLPGFSQLSINPSSDDGSNAVNIFEGLDFSSANLLANSTADFCAKESPLPAMNILSPVQETTGGYPDKSKGANFEQLGLIDLEESPMSGKEGAEEGTSLRASNEEALSKSPDESSVEHAA